MIILKTFSFVSFTLEQAERIESVEPFVAGVSQLVLVGSEHH